jgi:hypothetical protein
MEYIKEVRLITENSGYKFMAELEKLITELSSKNYRIEIQYGNLGFSYSALVIGRLE